MEILQRGKTRGDRVAVFWCNTCQSKLRASMNEGQASAVATNDVVLQYWCPVCGYPIFVEESRFQ